MVWVRIQIGKGYIPELKRRMKQYKISQNELARALDMDVSQVNRWFTKNETRQVTPTMAMVERIEETMLKLQNRLDGNS